MATAVKRGDSYKITVSCGYDNSGKQNNHVSLLINSTFFISKCYYGNAFVIIFRIIVFAGDYFIA